MRVQNALRAKLSLVQREELDEVTNEVLAEAYLALLGQNVTVVDEEAIKESTRLPRDSILNWTCVCGFRNVTLIEPSFGPTLKDGFWIVLCAGSRGAGLFDYGGGCGRRFGIPADAATRGGLEPGRYERA